MIVYWSILIYTTVMGYITNLKTKHYIREKEKFNKVPKMLAFLTFFLLIFLVGIRTNVMDTLAYTSFYKNLSVDSINFSSIGNYGYEPGFVLFSMIVKRFISSNPNVWLIIIAFICGYSIMSTLRKYSLNFGFSSYLFIASTMFTWMINGMRQFICVCVLFYFIDWILQRKTLKFVLLVLILSTIHFSCLVMILVYFIVQSKPWDKKFVIIIILLGFVMIFSDAFINVLSNALLGTPYSGITENFNGDDGVNPIRVLVNGAPLILACMFKSNLLRLNSKIMNLSINMCFLSVVVYIIGTVTSGILVGRIPIYFSVYSLILIPNIIEYEMRGENKKIMYMVVFFCYLLYFYYQMIIAWGGLEYYSPFF